MSKTCLAVNELYPSDDSDLRWLPDGADTAGGAWSLAVTAFFPPGAAKSYQLFGGHGQPAWGVDVRLDGGTGWIRLITPAISNSDLGEKLLEGRKWTPYNDAPLDQSGVAHLVLVWSGVELTAYVDGNCVGTTSGDEPRLPVLLSPLGPLVPLLRLQAWLPTALTASQVIAAFWRARLELANPGSGLTPTLDAAFSVPAPTTSEIGRAHV